MKKLFIIFTVLAVISTSIFAAPRPSSPSRSYSRSSSSVSSDCSNALFDACAELLITLSYYNNIMASYDNYPYATRNNYINLGEKDDTQFYRFTADTSLVFVPSLNAYGNDFRFEGYIWKFFGPVFENRIIVDPYNNTQYGEMDLGMQFSVFQFSLCSMIVDIKWEHLYGIKYYNGVNLGFGLKSYPINPLVIEYRAEWGYFNKSGNDIDPYTGIRKNSTFKSHLEAGAMLSSPVELYGYWDYIKDGFAYRTDNIFGIGVKYHF